jgi:hypothetical protein
MTTEQHYKECLWDIISKFKNEDLWGENDGDIFLVAENISSDYPLENEFIEFLGKQKTFLNLFGLKLRETEKDPYIVAQLPGAKPTRRLIRHKGWKWEY